MPASTVQIRETPMLKNIVVGLTLTFLLITAISSLSAQPLEPPQGQQSGVATQSDPASGLPTEPFVPLEPEPLFEEPWYTVELIVFAWPDRPPEVHHINAGEPDLSAAVDPYPEGLPLPPGQVPEELGELETQADEGTVELSSQAHTGDPQGPEAVDDPVDTSQLPAELVDLFAEPVEEPDLFVLAQETFLSSAWRPLEESEFGLDGAWARLANSARVRPLIHLAWNQPEQVLGSERRVRIRGGEIIAMATDFESQAQNDGFIFAQAPEPEREVDGTVALAQGRYLHLDIDLYFRRLAAGDELLPGGGIWRSRNAEASSWVISERRRLRPEQVHYFDHERFGVIALVRSIEPMYVPDVPEPPPVTPASANPAALDSESNPTPTGN